ncbi:MAG: PEP-utilizing enzyme [Actinomycetota bacterium]|nr:PEP-utilizing enzyme [Actinomycetota bacterium]
MYLDLAALGRQAASNRESHAALVSGTVPDDADFAATWQEWLARYGHRGQWESDIASPRFAEEPGPVLQTLANGGYTPNAARRRSIRGMLTLPVWWQCRRGIAAREGFRDSAVRAYATVRDQLLALAQDAGASRLLPDLDALWLMSCDEVCALDRGLAPSPTEFTARRSERAVAAALDLPLAIRRHETPSSDPDDQHPDQVSGITLTDGDVQGIAWVLREPSTALPSGRTPDDTVLVARTSSPGWVPTWGLVCGVVVEIGGDLSHGSIILRELAIPAITNAQRATQVFRTGDGIQLRSTQGIAERLETPHNT